MIIVVCFSQKHGAKIQPFFILTKFFFTFFENKFYCIVIVYFTKSNIFIIGAKSPCKDALLHSNFADLSHFYAFFLNLSQG